MARRRRLAGTVTAAALGMAPLLLAGCAPRALVRRNAALERQVAADSATIGQWQRQAAALRQRCAADSARLAAATARLASVSQDSAVHARDAEIAALRDQLAKANAELDRIKRRLANPRP